MKELLDYKKVNNKLIEIKTNNLKKTTNRNIINCLSKYWNTKNKINI